MSIPLLGAAALLAFASPTRIGAPTRAALASGDEALAVVAFEVDATLALRSQGRAAAVERTTRELLAACGAHCRVYRTFSNVAGFAVWLDDAGATALLADSRVERIDLDLPGHGALGEAVAAANFAPVHELGHVGVGTSVVVVDSGVAANHPDLAGSVVGETCFCQSGGAGCCPDGSTFQNGRGSADDDAGHGTGVTAAIASTGAVAGAGGAPGVEVFAVKVLDENQAFDNVADIVASLDALAELGESFAVINMSLGTDALYPGDCDQAGGAPAAILLEAVDSLMAGGTLVVVSSGNQGSSTETALPACLSNVISVGAIADADGFQSFGVCQQMLAAGDIACFSNSNDQVDIVAPGVDIRTSAPGGGTTDTWGTSFAAPLVSACIALMREAAPEATAEALRDALEASPTMVTDPRNDLVFPVLDCADAVSRVRDPDGDEVPDIDDNCPLVANPAQLDVDSDAAGDACDVCPTLVVDAAEGDPDEDGVCFDVDNCPDDPNPEQLDADADDVGDACDPCPADPLDDVDGDGVCGDVDACPDDPDPACVPAGSDGTDGADTTGAGDGTSGAAAGDEDEPGCSCGRAAPVSGSVVGSWWLLPLLFGRRRTASR